MDEKPLISVVIPCYNDGKYVEQSVESVLVQTYTNTEIIIVDDGSSDPHTIRILDRLADEKPLRLIRKGNKGLPAARNTGIEASEGDYILPLDADDYFEPAFIERVLPVLLSDPEVRAVSSWARKFGVYEGIIELKGGTLRDFVTDSRVMPASLFRKADWQAVGGFDESMVLGYEDWEFWIRMLKNGGRIHVIPEPLFNYRNKPGSLAVTSGINRYAIMEYMVAKNLDVYRQYPLEAVMCSERLLRDTKEKYGHLLQQVYRSHSYRLGYFLLSPFRWMKKVTQGNNT